MEKHIDKDKLFESLVSELILKEYIIKELKVNLMNSTKSMINQQNLINQLTQALNKNNNNYSWKYKFIGGKMNKKLYNKKTNEEITDWILM